MSDTFLTTCRCKSAQIIGGLRRKLGVLQHRLYVPPLTQRVEAWWADDSREDRRYTYDLSEQSVVLDVGGYRGDWASDIFARYRCHVHVFEPVPEFADDIERRFERNDRITVHALGLAGRTYSSSITLRQDRSSVYRDGEGACQIQLVAAQSFFEEHGMARVDLMKINIEGGEYELIQHLLDSALIDRIDNIQVQFHEDAIPGARKRMQWIQSRLRATHETTYQYDFVWENWRRRALGQQAAA